MRINDFNDMILLYSGVRENPKGRVRICDSFDGRCD